jgi:hypothetical protein
MSLWQTIVETYPELIDADFNPTTGIITLIDDGDGIVYIEKWNYQKPIPNGLKLGK